MGVGSATGKDKAEMAAKAAISSPLLETSISGAKGILVNITASKDIGLEEIDIASAMITSEASPDANVIWGVAFDPDLEDKMKITIIATGFENKAEDGDAAAAPAAAPASGDDEDEKKTEEPVSENGELSAISDDDFNEIMNMLKKGRKAAEQPKTPGRPNNLF